MTTAGSSPSWLCSEPAEPSLRPDWLREVDHRRGADLLVMAVPAKQSQPPENTIEPFPATCVERAGGELSASHRTTASRSPRKRRASRSSPSRFITNRYRTGLGRASCSEALLRGYPRMGSTAERIQSRRL